MCRILHIETLHTRSPHGQVLARLDAAPRSCSLISAGPDSYTPKCSHAQILTYSGSINPFCDIMLRSLHAQIPPHIRSLHTRSPHTQIPSHKIPQIPTYQIPTCPSGLCTPDPTDPHIPTDICILDPTHQIPAYPVPQPPHTQPKSTSVCSEVRPCAEMQADVSLTHGTRPTSIQMRPLTLFTAEQ